MIPAQNIFRPGATVIPLAQGQARPAPNLAQAIGNSGPSRMPMQHGGAEPAEDPEMGRCDLCGKVMVKGSVARHRKICKANPNPVKIPCPNCGRLFSRLSTLNNHLSSPRPCTGPTSRTPYRADRVTGPIRVAQADRRASPYPSTHSGANLGIGSYGLAQHSPMIAGSVGGGSQLPAQPDINTRPGDFVQRPAPMTVRIGNSSQLPAKPRINQPTPLIRAHRPLQPTSAPHVPQKHSIIDLTQSPPTPATSRTLMDLPNGLVQHGQSPRAMLPQLTSRSLAAPAPLPPARPVPPPAGVSKPEFPSAILQYSAKHRQNSALFGTLSSSRASANTQQPALPNGQNRRGLQGQSAGVPQAISQPHAKAMKGRNAIEEILFSNDPFGLDATLTELHLRFPDQASFDREIDACMISYGLMPLVPTTA